MMRHSTSLIHAGLVAAAFAALHPSCAPIVPVSPAPLYHRLDYEPVSAGCSQSFSGGVRVWRFSEASPYDRSEMTVVEPEGKVSFSNTHRWVSDPGALVAESLIRDLTLDQTFPRVVGDEDPAAVPYEITGRVFEFGWIRGNGSGKAVLQVEVCLIRKSRPPEVVFRRLHEMESEPFEEDSADTFASAMSDAMCRFSSAVRRDLCAGAAEFSQASPK
jgi:ABC-type uncharacterized transport system auxiliary subunit